MRAALGAHHQSRKALTGKPTLRMRASSSAATLRPYEFEKMSHSKVVFIIHKRTGLQERPCEGSACRGRLSKP